jgi:hypothetical protein
MDLLGYCDIHFAALVIVTSGLGQYNDKWLWRQAAPQIYLCPSQIGAMMAYTSIVGDYMVGGSFLQFKHTQRDSGARHDVTDRNASSDTSLSEFTTRQSPFNIYINHSKPRIPSGSPNTLALF